MAFYSPRLPDRERVTPAAPMTSARRLVFAGFRPDSDSEGRRSAPPDLGGRRTAPARVGGPPAEFQEFASVGRAAIRASNWRADCADFDGAGDVLCEPGEQISGSTAATYPHLAGPATNDELPPMLCNFHDASLKDLQDLPPGSSISQGCLPSMNVGTCTVNSLPAWSEESSEDEVSEASAESD